MRASSVLQETAGPLQVGKTNLYFVLVHADTTIYYIWVAP